MVRCANRYIIAYLFYNTKQMVEKYGDDDEDCDSVYQISVL